MTVRPTVLLVDDSPFILGALRAFLENEPLELVDADDGDRAWQLIRLMRIDLVIADINLPGVSGIELLERLRSADEPHLRDLPVLLHTHDASPDVQEHGRRAGANAFLMKGGSPEALVDVVRRLIAKRGTP